MTATYDGVIIGGGHNGLVCGAYLAKAGQRVSVVERREMVGGASVSEEIWPGYKVSTAAYTMALLQPRIILELELARHGFEVCKPTPMTHLFGGGKSMVMAENPAALHAEFAQFSAKDADAYPRYRAHIDLEKRVRQDHPLRAIRANRRIKLCEFLGRTAPRDPPARRTMNTSIPRRLSVSACKPT
jgi:phytoene dehydrogenase-like protein